MIKRFLILPVLVGSFFVRAQQIKIEFDKKTDLSHYKTFRFGDGQIITPKDERVIPDATIHAWVKNAVTEELTEKGLVRVDTTADIIISYLTGTAQRMNSGNVGPLGMTPGTSDRTYMIDYQQGSLVIDLNDTRTNTLIWRVNATTNTNLPEAKQNIIQIVERGFKKFSLKPKKPKK
jgi:hypothetical protein